MSSLLEQAIIDAKVLKETARKSAEAAILDQYSDVIKSNIDMLLEQDEEPSLAPSGAAQPPMPAPSDPSLAAGVQAAPSPTQKKLMDRIPPAYLGEDNMQEIEINLDTLLEKVDALEAEVGPIVAGIDMDRPAHEHGNPTLIAPDGIAEAMDEDVFTIDESLMQQEDPAIASLEAQGKKEIASGNSKLATAAGQSAAAARTDTDKPGKASMSDLAEELEEEGLELEEEMTFDYVAEDDIAGGIHAGRTETRKKENMLAAVEAQNEELHEELGLKEQEIAALEEKLNAMKAGLQETRSKLKSATQTNVALAENVKKIVNSFHDISLLNARLLYTNKALTNTSLNERQKNVIAEAISKAKSVDQAKTIYETLKQSAGATVSRNAPKSLNEAINRSPSPFLPRVNNTVDPSLDRMRILAGIKK